MISGIKGIVATSVWLVLTSVVQAQALLPYQNKKRPLIVFAPSEQHASLMRQKAAINGFRTALSDRDLVVIYVVGEAVNAEFGAKPGMSAASLRSTYRASEGVFRVLLIEKDGRTRVDSAAPLSANDIIAELDRVPTRRDVVRQRSQ